MAFPETAQADGIGRRDFLRLVALGLAATAIPRSASALSARKKPHKTTKVVYRLSTHGRHNCNACKAHGANKYFRSRKAADQHRAHPGCNCKILAQVIDRTQAKQFFKGRKKVFDLRSEVV